MTRRVRMRARVAVLGVLVAMLVAVAPRLEAQAEFRVTALATPTIRNAVFASAAQQGTGAGGTVEVLLRSSVVGVQVRTFGVDLDRGLSLAAGDLRVLIGPQAFTIELGGMRRVLAGPLANAGSTFGRAGVRTTFPLGGSGLRGMIGGWALSGVQLASGIKEAAGLEAETALMYRPGSLPVFVQLGYRAEALNVTLATGAPAPEEVGVVTLGAGISFGGRPR